MSGRPRKVIDRETRPPGDHESADSLHGVENPDFTSIGMTFSNFSSAISIDEPATCLVPPLLTWISFLQLLAAPG